ncbi:MAG: choice-of-anchor D domain-containing protein [candidate division KSB1 bacterium]|nr:choice-of-anchor D domain-containing protein [candidate division KSB1 bacterium]
MTSSRGGGLFVLNNSNGALLRNFILPQANYLSEPVLDDSNHVYLVTDSLGLISISASGVLRWSLPEVTGRFSPGFGGDGTIYIAGPRHLSAVGSLPPQAAHLVLNADSLDFGKICIDSTSTQQITIFNRGTIELRVTTMSIPPPFEVDTTPFTLPPAGQRMLAIKFRPRSVAAHPGTLAIQSNGGDATVRLMGVGMAPEMRLAASPPQFGELCRGNQAATAISIINMSDCVLRVDSIGVIFSAPALVSKSSLEREASTPFFVAPHDTFTFGVAVNPQNFGHFQVEVTVFSNAGNGNPQQIVVRGTVVPPIIAGVDSVDFGAVAVGSTAQRLARVWNDGNCPAGIDSLRIVGVDAIVFAAEVTGLPKTLGHGDTLEIPVRFSPDDDGTHRATLLVFYDHPQIKTLAIALLGVAGCGSPRIAGPDSLLFDSTTIGKSTQKTLTLQNASACVLRLTAVQIAGPDSLAFATTARLPITVAPQQEAHFDVSFLPRRLGSHTATLLIHSNDPTRTILPITLFGEGQTTTCVAHIEVDTRELSFREVALGDTATLRFSIRNAGCDSLRIEALRTSAAAFSAILEAPRLPLLPGASREVIVTFVPTDTTDYSSTLQILSNDPQNPTHLIPLNGRGKLPWTVASPFGFEKICLGTQASVEFTIRNISRRALSAEVRLKSPSPFTLDTPSIFIPPGDDRTIAVGFSPDAIRTFRDTLTVIWQSPLRLPALHIPLRGEGTAPQIVVLPVQVDFGSVLVGASSPPIFTAIRNDGQCELIVNKIEVVGRDSAAFTFENIGLPLVVFPGQFVRLGVTYTPKDSSVHQAALRMTSSDPVNPVVFLPLRGSGRMLLAACINIFQNHVDFGPAPIKTKDSAWVHLQNCGTAALVIDRVEINEHDYRFDRGSFRIAPQGVDSIKVYFVPSRAGRIDAKMFLHNNDPDQSIAVVELTGSGLARSGAFVMAKPNPITPNGDGKNEVARILFHDFELFNPKVKLFDLRGIPINTLFQQAVPGEIHWDGCDENRQLVLPGVYLWVLEDGGKKIASGSITVIR